MKSFFFNIISVCLLLYGSLALYLIFGGWPEKLILFPTREPLKSPGVSSTILNWSGKSLELCQAGNLEKAQVYLLHFVGNASRAETDLEFLQELWRDYPVALFSLNYPGYGASSGPPKLAQMPKAALYAYDHLLKLADGKPVLLSGNSIGTAVALYVASRRKPSAVFLKNPPPLQSLILGEHGSWNFHLLAWPIAVGIPPELNSLINAKQVNAPALILSSEKDEIVPPKYQAMVLKAYAGEKHLCTFKGAEHNDFPLPFQEPALKNELSWLYAKAGGER